MDLNKNYKLNKQQSRALALMCQDKNIFITAPAGAGKTLLINHYCDYVRQHEPFKKIAITSTTGVSAILIGGSTLHSYLGIGLGYGTIEELVQRIKKASKGIKERVWKELTTLIIDEVSMLNPVLFDKLEKIARIIRGSNLPFGGIQLILSGDLLQLPVVKGAGNKNDHNMEFVTDANSWKKCIGNNIVLLTEIMRQKDFHFKEILLKIRVGNIDKQVRSVLSQHMKKENNKKLKKEEIQPTRLFCLKKYVQDLNDSELKKLEDSGKKFINFNALVKKYSEEAILTNKGRSRCTDLQFKFLSDRFVKDSTTPQHLRVCEGAQVMLTYNIDQLSGLVNGSRGVIIGFTEMKFPIVRFKNHKRNNLAPKLNKTNEDIKSDSTFQPQVMENPETKVSKTDDEEINNTLELEVRPQTWEICNDFGKKIGYFNKYR